MIDKVKSYLVNNINLAAFLVDLEKAMKLSPAESRPLFSPHMPFLPQLLSPYPPKKKINKIK